MGGFFMRYVLMHKQNKIKQNGEISLNSAFLHFFGGKSALCHH